MVAFRKRKVCVAIHASHHINLWGMRNKLHRGTRLQKSFLTPLQENLENS